METDEVIIPKLTVKTLSDTSISIELSSSIRTIGDVKIAIEKHGTLAASKQIIIRDGQVLEDQEPVPQPSTTLYLFYYEPAALVADPIDKAIDWDTKNRMRVFKGFYLLSIRKFHEAAPLLVDSLTTFSELTFMTFRELVRYTIIAGMVALDRPTIQQKLVKSPEVLEVINDLPHYEAFINSYYNCRYGEFFVNLCKLHETWTNDWLLAPHAHYINKELRLRAYQQMLQSYRSVSLASMAEMELCRFISAGRLNCTIDLVGGVVVTNVPDARNDEYLGLLKNGDALMARMQKLGRLLSY